MEIINQHDRFIFLGRKSKIYFVKTNKKLYI